MQLHLVGHSTTVVEVMAHANLKTVFKVLWASLESHCNNIVKMAPNLMFVKLLESTRNFLLQNLNFSKVDEIYI